MINKAFYLVTLVVRGGVEPPAFRFQVWAKPLPRTVPADQEAHAVRQRQLVDGDVAVRAAVTGEGFYSM